MAEKNYTLLVVEDQAAMRKIAEIRLKSKGFIVLTAVNGTDGLEKIKNNKIDLVVSDVMMPDMNGFELCQKVKEIEEYKNIPFIMLTAKDSFDAKMEGLKYGADRYLTKPYEFQELLDVGVPGPIKGAFKENGIPGAAEKEGIAIRHGLAEIGMKLLGVLFEQVMAARIEAGCIDASDKGDDKIGDAAGQGILLWWAGSRHGHER